MNEMIMVCHSLINSTDKSLIISLCSNTNPFGQSDPPEPPQILDIYSVVVL